jgi:hypothetical protein
MIEQRLLRRATHPLGLIDVRQPQQRYDRATAWASRHLSLVERALSRTGGDAAADSEGFELASTRFAASSAEIDSSAAPAITQIARRHEPAMPAASPASSAVSRSALAVAAVPRLGPPSEARAIQRKVAGVRERLTPRATAIPAAQSLQPLPPVPSMASHTADAVDTPLVVRRKHTKSADIAAPNTFNAINRASTPKDAVVAPISRAIADRLAQPTHTAQRAPSIASQAGSADTPLVVQRKHNSGNVVVAAPSLDASSASAPSARSATSDTYAPLVIQRKHDSSTADFAAQASSTDVRVPAQSNTQVEPTTVRMGEGATAVVSTHVHGARTGTPLVQRSTISREIAKPASSQAIIWRRADPAAPMRAFDTTRPSVIQRQPHDISRSPDSESADVPAPAKPADAPSSDSSVDLVDRVTRSLIKQIAIERERRGGGRWP